eukprot:10551839-Lingulodinium_polyedra.AAC.1
MRRPCASWCAREIGTSRCTAGVVSSRGCGPMGLPAVLPAIGARGASEELEPSPCCRWRA